MPPTLISRSIILYAPEFSTDNNEQNFLLKNVCGLVAQTRNQLETLVANKTDKKTIYLTGNIKELLDFIRYNEASNESVSLYILKKHSRNYEEVLQNYNVYVVDDGKVPISMFGVGVLFRHMFDDSDYFQRVHAAHKFQSLTESNKQGTAMRRGIYLSEVVSEKQQDCFSFHLMRCSSNFDGPTDNFRDVDREILDKLNNAAEQIYEQPARLNHVLAQIYYNTNSVTGDGKTQKKAKISRHSDKTKDMPDNGLIAFTTFYDFDALLTREKNFYKTHSSKTDEYDLCYKHNTSILTQLEFVLKEPAKHPTHEKKFRITLYPNSVFFISLETNRLYTHEIKPSTLDVDKIPTRMGYVVRCSKTKAIHRNNQTFIVENGKETPLNEMSDAEMTKIKDLYRDENLTDKTITYGRIFTSLNGGDYLQPLT